MSLHRRHATFFVLVAGTLCRASAPAEPVQTPDRLGDLIDIGTRKSGCDWPRFLGPTGDNKSPERGIVVPWPDTGPRLVWHREVGSGYGIGCVSRGRYYHFDRVTEDGEGRSSAARVACLQAETGDTLWEFRYDTNYEDLLGYDNGPRASPIVDGNRVFTFGPDGMLHCLKADDGALQWKVDTKTKFGVVQNFFGVGSTPVIAGNLLLCMIGGSPPDSPELYESGGRVEGNGTGIVAFDKHTGEVVYRLTDELASYATIRLAEIDGRAWGFAFARGGLVGFDPIRGTTDFVYPWRARLLESVNASTPVVVGNEVFVSEAYQVGSSLLSVRPGSYTVSWADDRHRRDKSMKLHWNTPIFVDGFLYGCSGRHSHDAELRCIEWKTGQVRWSDAGHRPERCSLLYTDDHFVSLGEFGLLELIRVNPKACERISEVVLRDQNGEPLLKYPCWAAPILAHGLLYVRGKDRVACIELITPR